MSQRTVLITGCTPGGIGYELAQEYAAKGLRVFATARRTEALGELTSLHIPCMEPIELDVTKIQSIKAARDHVASLTGGKLDILVNNAGQSYSVPATDVDIEEVQAMFDINIFGVMRMVQEFTPLLIASGDGRIVNIGSIAGVMPYPFGSAYNASKAALHSYGNTLRLELAPFNIQVLTIITGGVKSNISSHRSRLIKPSSLYAPIAEIFAQRRAGRSQVGAMSTKAYAQSVVAQTLKHRVKAWFWIGSFSLPCWIIDTFFGRRGFDWLFSWRFALHHLKNLLRLEKKQM
ncbi:Arabinanase/levansucrase/invertase superfamily protein [Favolaschia claudopus]|uniref:Arabinanase/levansucrase/invertase superfamily protein n=1 Tax=Favolaschia claudopus TaxID=2862362 RepID=A0AAW0DVT9_9AGAR